MVGGVQPIIWPLIGKIFQPIFLMQRPRSTAHRPILKFPILPWNIIDRPPLINAFGRLNKVPILADIVPYNFGLCNLGIEPIRKTDIYSGNDIRQTKNKKPTVIHNLKPLPAKYYSISGYTLNNLGAVNPFCEVILIRNSDNFGVDEITSDGNGYYEFRSGSPINNYYIVSFKSGTVAGVTLNNLLAT